MAVIKETGESWTSVMESSVSWVFYIFSFIMYRSKEQEKIYNQLRARTK